MVSDVGQVCTQPHKLLHGHAHDRGSHIEAGVPTLWNVHDPLVLRPHRDQCVHLGPAVLASLSYSPQKLATCSTIPPEL